MLQAVAPGGSISVKWGVGREIAQCQCQRVGNSPVLLQECWGCCELTASLQSCPPGALSSLGGLLARAGDELHGSFRAALTWAMISGVLFSRIGP